jgi:putative ABC transport system ATP-binding protein
MTVTATATLRLDGVSHSYQGPRRAVKVLREVSIEFQAGTFYTVLGPSGTGKTTLLGLAAGLDTPSSGKILYQDTDVRDLGLSRYRNKHVATIFQSFNLLSYMTAVQNVITAMEITGVKVKGGNRRHRAAELLERVGLDPSEAKRNVRRLSGGQQQRVAIARAIACDVDILCADEPTGNLDQDTAGEIVALFQKLAHDDGKTVIVATHSLQVAQQSDQTLTLSKGKLTGGKRRRHVPAPVEAEPVEAGPAGGGAAEPGSVDEDGG